MYSLAAHLPLPSALTVEYMGEISHTLLTQKGAAEMRERTLQINIRMTPPEREAIMRKAQKAKMPLSHYIILSALNKTIVSTEELKQVHFLLKNISGNVNQLTVLSHQGKINTACQEGGVSVFL